MANASGLIRPAMRTETVCSEFCKAYAMITGIDPLARILNSESHNLAIGVSSSEEELGSPSVEDVGEDEAGLGRREDCSLGVEVSEGWGDCRNLGIQSLE